MPCNACAPRYSAARESTAGMPHAVPAGPWRWRDACESTLREDRARTTDVNLPIGGEVMNGNRVANINMSEAERWAGVIGGSLLAFYGVRRGGNLGRALAL